MTKDQFDQALAAARAELCNTLEGLNGTEFQEPTVTSIALTRNCDIDRHLANIPSGHKGDAGNTDFVYIIRLAKDAGTSVKELHSAVEDLRQKIQKKDFCKINEKHISNTLYVGRSKTLRSRLSQHLGAANHGVYAMHMQRWVSQNPLKLEISYLTFKNESNLLIQTIEDALWTAEKPAFGKKGGR